MVLPDPVTTFIEAQECPKLPEISPRLLVPCYADLMPAETVSDDMESKLKALVDDYAKMQKCYQRQYDLITELENARTTIE